MQCTPIAATIAQRDASVRAAIEREVVDGWQQWLDGGRLAYEQPVLIVTARNV